MTFFLKPDGRVWGLWTTAAGVETSLGVGIADSLALARDRYPALDCTREYHQDDGPAGDPFCSVTLDLRSHLFFGGNPIDAIVVSRRRVG